MATYDLDPGGLRSVATNTESSLESLEDHRTDASAAIDEAAGSVESAEVTAALLNVWNLMLAPQFEGVEQRIEKMTSGLTNAANHFDNGDFDMVGDATRSTDAAVEINIDDAKQVTAGE